MVHSSFVSLPAWHFKSIDFPFRWWRENSFWKFRMKKSADSKQKQLFAFAFFWHDIPRFNVFLILQKFFDFVMTLISSLISPKSKLDQKLWIKSWDCDSHLHQFFRYYLNHSERSMFPFLLCWNFCQSMMQSMGEHLYLPDLLPLRSLKIIPNETLIVNERSKSTPSQSLRVNLFLAVLMLMEDVGENFCWRKTCTGQSLSLIVTPSRFKRLFLLF